MQEAGSKDEVKNVGRSLSSPYKYSIRETIFKIHAVMQYMYIKCHQQFVYFHICMITFVCLCYLRRQLLLRVLVPCRQALLPFFPLNDTFDL